MNKVKYPRSFSHIGITVPDIQKAVELINLIFTWKLYISQ